jgi:hypothetical protein
MNSNFNLFKANQYLNKHINDIIKDNYFQLNPNVDTRILYSSFLINYVLYHSNTSESNIFNSIISENTANTIPKFQTEKKEKSTMDSDCYNLEYPKLIQPKKRWSNTFSNVE